jgi:hypothetical protein
MKRILPVALAANLLASTCLVAPLVALSGCATQSSTGPASQAVTTAQAISDASAMVAALSNTVDQIVAAQPTLIPAAQLPQIKSWLATAQDALAKLSSTVSDQQAATTLQQVTQAVESVLGSLNSASALIPPPYSTVIEAATVILPVISAFVQTALNQINAPAAPVKVGRPAQVAQARLILRAAAAHR